MGGGDDRGEIEAEAADEDRGGGRRQHPAEQGVAAGLGDPGGQRRFQHRPRLARVADDQHLRPRGLQRGGRGPAERQRQLRGEERPSLPSDPVGSEELALRAHSGPLSAC